MRVAFFPHPHLSIPTWHVYRVFLQFLKVGPRRHPLTSPEKTRHPAQSPPTSHVRFSFRKTIKGIQKEEVHFFFDSGVSLTTGSLMRSRCMCPASAHLTPSTALGQRNHTFPCPTPGIGAGVLAAPLPGSQTRRRDRTRGLCAAGPRARPRPAESSRKPFHRSGLQFLFWQNGSKTGALNEVISRIK